MSDSSSWISQAKRSQKLIRSKCSTTNFSLMYLIRSFSIWMRNSCWIWWLSPTVSLRMGMGVWLRCITQFWSMIRMMRWGVYCCSMVFHTLIVCWKSHLRCAWKLISITRIWHVQREQLTCWDISGRNLGGGSHQMIINQFNHHQNLEINLNGQLMTGIHKIHSI